MIGCSSPLTSGERSQASADANAVIAKAVLDAAARGDLSHEPTIPQEVQELTMVDAAGPVTSSDNAVTPADAKATTTSSASPQAATSSEAATQPGESGVYAPNLIGLEDARLRQAEPIFDLSLQDCIARACHNNLAIKVEAYNPAIKESLIIQAEAAFDPILFGSVNAAQTDEPALIPNNGLNGWSVQNQIGIKQTLSSGAVAQTSIGQNYRWLIPYPKDPNNPYVANFQRSWTDNLNFTVTQPLARGFGTAVNEAQIYLAQRDRRISQATFRRQVITSLGDTEAAYHNLVQARTMVDIQQRLLNATELTFLRVWARKDIDADKIAVSQSIAAVEARRAELIRARANLRSQSDILKGLLNDPEINIRSNVLINPTDRPTSELVLVSTAEAIQTALQQRTELQEARLQLERADIIITVAKNNLLPKVDLTLGIQTNSLQDDYLNAFGRTFSGQYIDYNAGIRIEVPIGNRAAEAELVQYKHQRAQALTQMAKIAEDVVQDVKKQLRDLLTYHAEIQARERARISAAEELLAISQKENIEPLTPTFLQLKLDSQTRLAQAEQALITALVNYNIAMMRFEQSKGTLLEYNRVSLDRYPVSRYQDDAHKIRFMGETYMLR